MQPANPADFTGDGSTHPLSATPQQAKWVQITAITVASAAAPIRVGGAGVTGSVGAPLFVQGASQFFPQDPTDLTARYELSGMEYNAASGDKFSLMYGI